ncbi:MAG: argininosuccinate lyase [Acidimicrobiia bacterium]
MTLWGGRFEGPMSSETWDFTVDHTDRRLLVVDIEGSIAHAGMLGATGIVPDAEAAEIVSGLEKVLGEARSGSFVFEDTDEDVHTAVERRLIELVGEVAGKLHSGRSRNDQVATDLRLYLRGSGEERADQLGETIRALIDLAAAHVATVIPSYTHLQQAQATSLGNHLLAHAWALVRDRGRLTDCLIRLNQSPLGAGAGGGSSLPIDRDGVANALGFNGPMPNTLDAVAARDFVAEYVFVCAQTMAHLSRLAEEIVLWSTREFGWVSLSDQVSSGSSALPHKRNPDIAELIRGRAAVVAGDVAAILGLQKGLPLTYNRDLQEDKRIVFHADDTVAGSLRAMVTLLDGLEFHPPSPSPETASLDLAEALVARGVPFREAHHIVGELVKRLERQGRALADLDDDDLTAHDPRFQTGDIALLDPEGSVRRRGLADSVTAQIAALRTQIDG